MRLIIFWCSLFATVFSPAAEPEELVLKALKEVEQGWIGRGNMKSFQVSPYILECKKDEIATDWEKLGETMRKDHWTAMVEDKKVVGTLAAVSVSLHGPVSPDEARILVFGLIQVDGGWRVADGAGLCVF